jgi:hypothetical protein
MILASDARQRQLDPWTGGRWISTCITRHLQAGLRHLLGANFVQASTIHQLNVCSHQSPLARPPQNKSRIDMTPTVQVIYAIFTTTSMGTGAGSPRANLPTPVQSVWGPIRRHNAGRDLHQAGVQGGRGQNHQEELEGNKTIVTIIRSIFIDFCISALGGVIAHPHGCGIKS